MENNKLIAEFMGAIIIETYYNEDKSINHFLMDMGKNRTQNSRYISDITMLYHKSWDWLIPVVEKIESLGYYTKIYSYTIGYSTEHYMAILTYDDKTQYENLAMNRKFTHSANKLTATYNAVIEFITWYNTQKK
jgi:hypothetical protein